MAPTAPSISSGRLATGPEDLARDLSWWTEWQAPRLSAPASQGSGAASLLGRPPVPPEGFASAEMALLRSINPTCPTRPPGATPRRMWAAPGFPVVIYHGPKSANGRRFGAECPRPSDWQRQPRSPADLTAVSCVLVSDWKVRGAHQDEFFSRKGVSLLRKSILCVGPCPAALGGFSSSLPRNPESRVSRPYVVGPSHPH